MIQPDRSISYAFCLTRRRRCCEEASGVTVSTVGQAVAIAFLVSLPAVAQFDGIPTEFASAIAYREQNFSHCYCKLTVEDFGTKRKASEITIDSWVRGQSVRNDIHGDRECRVIIHQGVYVVQLAGDKNKIITAPVSEYKDPWKEFGVVHQRDIGMVENCLVPQAHGKSRWLLKDFQNVLAQSSDRVNVQKASASGLTQFSATIRSRVPERITAEVMSGDVELKDYLDANPDIPLVEFESEYRINFSPLNAGQLTDYESKTLSLSDGTGTRTHLVNIYQKESTTGIWYPKTSVWEHYYNDELIIGRRVEILEVDFKTIPDSVFTLAGVSLEDGVRVTDRLAPEGQRIGKIVNGAVVFRQPQTTRPVGIEQNTGFSKWFVATSLLIIGLIILVTGAMRLKRFKSN